MIEKNLSKNEIFTVLNSIKQSIGLGVSSFIDNGLNEKDAIKQMEQYFNIISETIKQYYIDKKIKNKIKISIQLIYDSNITYWNDKQHLDSLKIELAHKFHIPIKCIETRIDF